MSVALQSQDNGSRASGPLQRRPLTALSLSPAQHPEDRARCLAAARGAEMAGAGGHLQDGSLCQIRGERSEDGRGHPALGGDDAQGLAALPRSLSLGPGLPSSPGPASSASLSPSSFGVGFASWNPRESWLTKVKRCFALQVKERPKVPTK